MPSKKHYPVQEYIHPDLFQEYKEFSLQVGIPFCESSPMHRSSYKAEEIIPFLKQRLSL